MSPFATPPPLEDELGDVLEKALHFADLTIEQAAAAAAVPEGKLRDALDYRSELSAQDLTRLAAVLHLNELGLAMLAQGAYPLPAPGPLPFCLHRLSVPHGIGCANAYLIAEPGANTGILFDTGPDLPRIQQVWPSNVQRVEAVFLTHVEAEHVGGLVELLGHYAVQHVFSPESVTVRTNAVLKEGDQWTHGGITVTVISTPGHAKAHFAYLVEASQVKTGQKLLICGDLLFAGSLGGGYFCWKTLRDSARRLMKMVPPEVVIAPGHGPLTTAENELRYNPFFP
ncbi:MBL fold metallo-hydrolase [Horticoccus luteus]|uniref:MBL fold metallo-hydrolase n=1 Tax=Horticoccus luteus TaxID=2862869 RepID=A0A8F9TSP5_9BACT|nr:MBL fold metallo-hydrolase [Horticoccus luteus]QYM78345.1 MBL fold metallo-hydrolase [Horticoccus luteus]